MHRQVGLVGQQRRFQLLDEQALATDLGQRGVQQLVAAADHRDQADSQPGVQLFKTRLDVFGLPQGQGALAGGDSQMSTHGILAVYQRA